jgi:hypothetical protein
MKANHTIAAASAAAANAHRRRTRVGAEQSGDGAGESMNKKVKRSMTGILVVGALLGALGMSPGSASASPDATTVFHFKGSGGHSLLNDCPPAAPVGTHCRALNVHAAEERLNDNGELSGGPWLRVLLFDVTFIAEEPGYLAELVGVGVADVATVEINGFAGGSASATDVALCEEFECAPGAQDSISVDVEWTGFGPVDGYVEHDMGFDGFCWNNIHYTGPTRFATSHGTVDGVAWHQTPGFTPTLDSEEFGSVQRCTSV